eukprot:SAG31_NODE_14534_length_801_cov_0.727920_1_plen_132_part_00
MSQNFIKSKYDTDFFTIRHYAGDIRYYYTGFLLKNKDALRQELRDACRRSASPLVFEVIALDAGYDSVEAADKVWLDPNAGSGKAAANYVCTKFQKQLEDLVERLTLAETHYVRCIGMLKNISCPYVDKFL